MKMVKTPNGKWSVLIKGPDGRERSFKTNQTNYQLAQRVVDEAKVRELELASDIGALTGEVVAVLLTGKKITVANALPSWIEWMTTNGYSSKTIEMSGVWVRAWAKATKNLDKLVARVTEVDIMPWVNRPTPVKRSTRVVGLSHLTSFFKYCARKGWIMGNPASLVRVDYGKLTHAQKETTPHPIWTDDEVNRMMQHFHPETGKYPNTFWYAAVAISRYTGLRFGDIALLEWESLAVTGQMTVWTIKRDRRVQVPIPEEVVRAMQFVRIADPRYVFPHERNIYNDPKIRYWPHAKFRIQAQAIGIMGKTFHGLRVAFITECYKAGVPLEQIAKDVGHVYPATTMGYVRH